MKYLVNNKDNNINFVKEICVLSGENIAIVCDNYYVMSDIKSIINTLIEQSEVKLNKLIFSNSTDLDSDLSKIENIPDYFYIINIESEAKDNTSFSYKINIVYTDKLKSKEHGNECNKDTVSKSRDSKTLLDEIKSKINICNYLLFNEVSNNVLNCFNELDKTYYIVENHDDLNKLEYSSELPDIIIFKEKACNEFINTSMKLAKLGVKIVSSIDYAQSLISTNISETESFSVYIIYDKSSYLNIQSNIQ